MYIGVYHLYFIQRQIGALQEISTSDFIFQPLCSTQAIADSEPQYRSVIWGPTCDSLDKVSSGCRMPELHVGDWLLIDNMGAYSTCLTTDFNGFERAHVYPVVTAKTWHAGNLSCTHS